MRNRHAMELLERAPYLEELRTCLEQAAAGEGRALLLGGEAGAGKTVLVERFRRFADHRVRALVGSCDALSTPRPLGPLLDIAPGLDPAIQRLLDEGASRHALFGAVRSALAGSSRPVLLVIEDAHWADEATLDLLRYLIRRIEPLRCLLIVTYRDDEVGPRHPLRVVLGDVATAGGVRRLALPPLSRQAVARLAEGSALDPDELYRLTGGNPFYVSEVVAAREPGAPRSVRDAVLARAARLPPEARSVLDMAAVIGGAIDVDLLRRVAGHDLAGLDACVELGMLREHGTALMFRHELAREAIAGALLPGERMEYHRRVLTALQSKPEGTVDCATMAHHAEAAGDAASVLGCAPEAAREASARRAHREAAAQYARALRHAAALPPEERAELLTAHAIECYVSDQVDAGIASLKAAREIWRTAGARDREGATLRWLARLLWVAGQNAAAAAASALAVELLEPLPPGHELAMAYSARSQLRMLAHDVDSAVHWGEKAIALADRLGDVDAMVHALNNVGTARLLAEDLDGAGQVVRSLELALARDLEDDAARAWTNLGSTYSDIFAFGEAERYLREGIAYCAERDHDFLRLYMTARLAIVACYRGRWAEAVDLAHNVLAAPNIATVTRIEALLAVGLTGARRGDDDVAPILDEASELALSTGEIQRIGPVRAARAEAAWLAGDRDQVLAEARPGLREAQAARMAWPIGEFALWLHRVDGLDELPEGAAEPFVLEIQGDRSGAAAAWDALGCPYEAARARLGDDDERALRQALDELLRLDARPAVAFARHRLQEMGASAIPRGHRPSTRAHPALLTTRETEVLALMAEGDTYAEIAARLSVSPKTVEHHATAILRKLDVGSRREAIRAARRGALFPQNRESPTPG
jgi:DNA-binding CsgD family transcriptional regulator